MRTFGLEFNRALHFQRHYVAACALLHANRWIAVDRYGVTGAWVMCLAIGLLALGLGPRSTQAQPPLSLVPEFSVAPPLPAAGGAATEFADSVEEDRSQWPGRPAPLMIGLPTAYAAGRDQLVVEPQVQIGEPSEGLSDEMSLRWLQTTRPSAVLSEAPPFFFTQEELLLPPLAPGTGAGGLPVDAPSVLEVAPVFETLVSAAPLRRRRQSTSSEKGLGYERMAFSLFDIDPAQPFNNFRTRMVLGNRMRLPDRAEYFWGRTVDGRGPSQGESVLNYQDLRFRMETGSKNFSATFEVPFRAVDPVMNLDHAGLGDLEIITKTVLISGNTWLLTQYFGSYMPTGAVGMGLGTGHVSLEPGLLFRHKWNDESWLHGELKFWFPLGADPAHSGQVLKFAVGMNRVWYETDHSAWLPSLELTSYSVLNGLARDATGEVQAVDGDLMLYLTPGLHYAYDGRGDFGLFEIGSAISLVTTSDRFTDSTLTCDVRWSW